MKTRRNMVKRWIAGVLAVTMLSSTMSTAAFAAPESTDAPETVETTRVTAWNWTDGSALTWQEDTSAWTLTLSEEQTISAEADLLALLPVSVEATLAQAETESTPAPETAATPAPESTPDTEATEVTPTPVAEVDPAAEEGATAPAAAALAQPEEGATGADTLSVEPQNNEEATPAPETATPAPTAAPQPAESPAPTADAEPTEEPAATETLTLTWDTAALTYPLAGGDYTVTAALPEGYALDETAPALAVVVKVPGAEEEDTPAADNSLSDSASAPSMLADAGTVQTVNPVGTTINLFDYWVGNSRWESDKSFSSVLWNDQRTTGINKNHTLKFSTAGTWDLLSGGNDYREGRDQYPEIVASCLGKDGYPYLNDQVVSEYWTNIGWPLTSSPGPTNESLAYLFDPSVSHDGKIPFTNVKDLLRIDENGYYSYDCATNYAYFNEAENRFTVYDGAPSGAAFFFPFDKYGDATKDDANHYFGLTMTTRFVQKNNGLTDTGTPITYEFKGDDDVWVFIDDVLVGDVGGIHGATELKIDFSTGAITVGGKDQGTLKDKFEAAGVTNGKWNGNTFENGTYHTLNFYFLERGNGESNLKLKFNMESVSESSIHQVDQNGNGIGGTTFTLYPAYYDKESKKYQVVENQSVFSGTTKADGMLNITDENNNNLSLSKLKSELETIQVTFNGQPKSCNAVVLRETNVPDGYRKESDTCLYFPSDWKQDVLLSANPWESGAYANPRVTTTLVDVDSIPTTGANSGSIHPTTESGTFFAVVMKGSGDASSGATEGWRPIYGDPISGWKMPDLSSGITAGSMEDVLAAAKASPYTFAPDNTGLRVNIEYLPGDLSQYYYIMKQNDPENAETSASYTVAYYYTSADTIEGATAQNTVRLDIDSEAMPENAISREFSVQVYVSNPKNYLVVQKVADDGTTLTGATFELYQDSQMLKDTEGNLVLDEKGNPQVQEGVAPFDTVTTANLKQAADMTPGDDDSYQSSVITLNGAGVFPNNKTVLPNGIYYLKEKEAPAGYETSEQLVKVIIDNTGVYADAGKAEDDVTVLRGAGKIVRSMLQFAVPDDINTTLTDITATLLTASDAPINLGDPWTWDDSGQRSLYLTYTASNVPLEYGPATPGDSSYFIVEEGWSRVTIKQTGFDPDDPANESKDLVKEDLTNLFSRSTIVRMASNPKNYGLTIAEAVSNPVGADTDKEFTVTVNLTKQDGSLIAGTLDYTKEKLPNVQDAAEVLENEKKGTWSADNNTLTLKHGQYITIQVPYDTKYTVTPTVETNYTTEIAEAAPLADGDPTRTETTGTLTANVTIGITNTRKAGSVAVSNTVEGAMGSYSDTFSYTLNLYDVTVTEDQPGKANISGTYTATITNTDTQITVKTVQITFANGVATTMTPVVAEGEQQQEAKAITLAHGDTLAIAGLPAGASFEAVETDDHKGYIVEVNPQKTGENGVSVDRTGLVTVPNTADAPASIAFANTREAIVPTGMREENNPYIVMIGLAGMAALVGAAGWVEMRRRKRREEE